MSGRSHFNLIFRIIAGRYPNDRRDKKRHIQQEVEGDNCVLIGSCGEGRKDSAESVKRNNDTAEKALTIKTQLTTQTTVD